MSVHLTPMDLKAPERAAELTLALFMDTLGDEAYSTMQDVAPEEDGGLKRGLALEKTGRFERLIVGQALHTEMVLRGTGLYGPKKRRITPRRAKALVFPWKAIGGRIAAFKGDLETPKERASFARWAIKREMVPFFTWPKGRPADNFAQKTAEIERTRLDVYLPEAAALVRRMGV